MTSAEDAAVTLGTAGGSTTPARQELVLRRRDLAEDTPDPMTKHFYLMFCK